MKQTFLEFEQPIAELEAKIEELRYVQDDSALDISEEITRLQKKSNTLTKEIYAKLSPWQISQVARHPQRPYTLDYIHNLFADFQELHGDRNFADDASIVGGLARFSNQTVMLIGHQKGRDTKEKLLRNFGMPRPEGYRKALRLMRLAEKFGMPVLTFIDTPGAYPGVGAEERGQSEAIGRNLYVMAELRVPIVVTVIGEGGSGRRAGDRGRRHGADAAILDLFGDFPRGMRLHFVEERGEGAGGGRDARHYRQPVEDAGPHRQDRDRAARAARTAIRRR